MFLSKTSPTPSFLTNKCCACFDTFSKTQVSLGVRYFNHHYNFDLVLLSGGHLVVLEDELSINGGYFNKRWTNNSLESSENLCMSRTNQGNQLTTHASWQKRFNVVFSIGRILSVYFGISMHGEKKT